MRCNNCKSENPNSAKFCIQCGELLKNICQSCEIENPREAKFCSDCGNKLGKM